MGILLIVDRTAVHNDIYIEHSLVSGYRNRISSFFRASSHITPNSIYSSINAKRIGNISNRRYYFPVIVQFGFFGLPVDFVPLQAIVYNKLGIPYFIQCIRIQIQRSNVERENSPHSK